MAANMLRGHHLLPDIDVIYLDCVEQPDSDDLFSIGQCSQSSPVCIRPLKDTRLRQALYDMSVFFSKSQSDILYGFSNLLKILSFSIPRNDNPEVNGFEDVLVFLQLVNIRHHQRGLIGQGQSSISQDINVAIQNIGKLCSGKPYEHVIYALAQPYIQSWATLGYASTKTKINVEVEKYNATFFVLHSQSNKIMDLTIEYHVDKFLCNKQSDNKVLISQSVYNSSQSLARKLARSIEIFDPASSLMLTMAD
jgi:hypothetical protein